MLTLPFITRNGGVIANLKIQTNRDIFSKLVFIREIYNNVPEGEILTKKQLQKLKKEVKKVRKIYVDRR